MCVAIVLSCATMSMASVAAKEATEFTVKIDTGEYVTIKDTDGDSFFEIGTADELYAFSEVVADGNTKINAILTDDIEINKNVVSSLLGENTKKFREWKPIGSHPYINGEYTYDYLYEGIFDGNNKTVSGLYLNDSKAEFVGFFGGTYEGCEIKNLHLNDSYISGSAFVGGITPTDLYTKISNCSYSGYLYSEWIVGGIVGVANFSITENCASYGLIKGEDYVGGIVGCNGKTSLVEACVNQSDIMGINSFGGIVGENYGGNIVNCTNLGRVVSAGPAPNNRETRMGGIVGVNNLGKIKSCLNMGVVLNDGDKAAGAICGANLNGEIKNCYYKDSTHKYAGYESDLKADVHAVSDQQIMSGEVAYNLGSPWGQTLGGNNIPEVYAPVVYKKDTSDGVIYTN